MRINFPTTVPPPAAPLLNDAATRPENEKAVVASPAPRLLKDFRVEGYGLLKVEAQLKPQK
jgi:hypothetical protein